MVGNSATLSCSVQSIPTTPTVTWEKEGSAFTRTDLVSDTSDSNSQSSKLTLNPTAAEDLGLYRCKAVFPADGDDFSGGTLFSEEAAVIVLYINMETAASGSKGDSLTLTATLINDKEVCGILVYIL